MKWVFTLLTVVLLFSWSFRWTEIEFEQNKEAHAIVSYKFDRWVGQTWAVYTPPMAEIDTGIDIPLFPSDKRFSTDEEAVKELEKRGKSGQLVESWRKRDLATYIWANLTALCLIASVIAFCKKRVKDFPLDT